jgi:hypothetical protein
MGDLIDKPIDGEELPEGYEPVLVVGVKDGEDGRKFLAFHIQDEFHETIRSDKIMADYFRKLLNEMISKITGVN